MPRSKRLRSIGGCSIRITQTTTSISDNSSNSCRSKLETNQNTNGTLGTKTEKKEEMPKAKDIPEKGYEKIATTKQSSVPSSIRNSSCFKPGAPTNVHIQPDRVPPVKPNETDGDLRRIFFQSSELFASHEVVIHQLTEITGCNLYDIVVHFERTREIVIYFERVLERLSPYRDYLLESEILVNKKCMSLCNEFRKYEKTSEELVDCFKKTELVFSKGTNRKAGSRRLTYRRKNSSERNSIDSESERAILKRTQDVLMTWVINSETLEYIWEILYDNLAVLCIMAERLERKLPVDMSEVLNSGDVGKRIGEKLRLKGCLKKAFTDSGVGLNLCSSVSGNGKNANDNKSVTSPPDKLPHTSLVIHKPSQCRNKLTETSTVDKTEKDKPKSKTSKKHELRMKIKNNDGPTLFSNQNIGNLDGGKAKESPKCENLNQNKLKSPSIAAAAAITTCKKTGLKKVEVFETSNDAAFLGAEFLSNLENPVCKTTKCSSKIKLDSRSKKSRKSKWRATVDIDYDYLGPIESEEDDSTECSRFIIRGTTSKNKFMSDLSAAITEAGMNNSKIAAERAGSKCFEEVAANLVAEAEGFVDGGNPPVLVRCDSGRKVESFCNSKCRNPGLGHSCCRRMDLDSQSNTLKEENNNVVEIEQNTSMGSMVDVGCQTDLPYGPGDFILLDESSPLVEVGEYFVSNEEGNLEVIFLEDSCEGEIYV